MSGKHNSSGFTIMELLVVLFLVTLLSSIVLPVINTSIQRAKESTLKENLFQIRKALDDFYTDNGQYPEELHDLVDRKYIRKIPEDSITESDDWKLLYSDTSESGQGIIDIKTRSEGAALDGSKLSEW